MAAMSCVIFDLLLARRQAYPLLHLAGRGDDNINIVILYTRKTAEAVEALAVIVKCH
jgi:hypothetical protein